MTLTEWKRKLKTQTAINCTYRWYWGKDKPAPTGGSELCVFVEVRATQAIYKQPNSDKPEQRCWMHYPKASELKADERGFEMYFPADEKWGNRSGILMSRYEWSA